MFLLNQIECSELLGETLPLFLSVILGGAISATVSYILFKLSLKNERTKKIIEIKQKRQQLKDDLSINWYFKVLLVPNTEMIESFFTDSKNHLKNSLRTIIEAKDNQTINDINRLNAKQIKQFKNLLSTFEFNFLMLLRSHEFVNDKKLLSWQNKLNDFYRTKLEEVIRLEESKIDVDEILKELAKFKIVLYTELYDPLKKKYD